MKHQIAKVELMDLQQQEMVHADPQPICNVADIAVELSVRLGKTNVTIGDVRQLKVGDLLPVIKESGHKVDVYLGEKKVGIGEAVLLDDKFGIIISEMKRSK
ncbi:FliM/FliN family flagellar motor switch protein [Ectobacillus antri]|uniref:FliM/FliN family flagellar motor switch protein n=1 Tax=Ectobacillus antri TaxID=2486280 RepID=A0ABT6H1N7_9BACI|nr:FliM/FliN family flagellar motor switch protein [Ectobacillus antri]MDG4656212.1 FliM/FliN family flagellar motor switch protein [Ectobacillus antri]MDG5752887.1 FliM/FliN family flagellar motor switch protein [Ectobacillus antri]